MGVRFPFVQTYIRGRVAVGPPDQRSPLPQKPEPAHGESKLGRGRGIWAGSVARASCGAGRVDAAG